MSRPLETPVGWNAGLLSILPDTDLHGCAPSKVVKSVGLRRMRRMRKPEMDVADLVTRQTKGCIRCGKRAASWYGHVHVDVGHGRQRKYVLAGWCKKDLEPVRQQIWLLEATLWKRCMGCFGDLGPVTLEKA
jgi:hypothetical protein